MPPPGQQHPRRRAPSPRRDPPHLKCLVMHVYIYTHVYTCMHLILIQDVGAFLLDCHEQDVFQDLYFLGPASRGLEASGLLNNI